MALYDPAVRWPGVVAVVQSQEVFGKRRVSESARPTRTLFMFLAMWTGCQAAAEPSLPGTGPVLDRIEALRPLDTSDPTKTFGLLSDAVNSVRSLQGSAMLGGLVTWYDISESVPTSLFELGDFAWRKRVVPDLVFPALFMRNFYLKDCPLGDSLRETGQSSFDGSCQFGWTSFDPFDRSQRVEGVGEVNGQVTFALPDASSLSKTHAIFGPFDPFEADDSYESRAFRVRLSSGGSGATEAWIEYSGRGEFAASSEPDGAFAIDASADSRISFYNAIFTLGRQGSVMGLGTLGESTAEAEARFLGQARGKLFEQMDLKGLYSYEVVLQDIVDGVWMVFDLSKKGVAFAQFTVNGNLRLGQTLPRPIRQPSETVSEAVFDMAVEIHWNDVVWNRDICENEPLSGSMTVRGSKNIVYSFNGATACDACIRYSGAGEGRFCLEGQRIF